MSDALAIVAALTGLVVGVGGLAFGWWNAKREREERDRLAERESGERARLEDRAQAQARQMAHDERSYESKAKAYEDVLFALGLVLVNLEAGTRRMAQRLGLSGTTRLEARSAGLSDSVPEGPRNEELLRLAARVGAFGSVVVSQRVEKFVEAAYELTKALDFVQESTELREADEERRQLVRLYVESRTNVVVAADRLEACEWMFRKWFPDASEPRQSWAQEHKSALQYLEHLRISPGSVLGSLEMPLPKKNTLEGLALDFEHRTDALDRATDAALDVFTDWAEKSEDPEVVRLRRHQLETLSLKLRPRAWQRGLAPEPRRRASRLELAAEPTLPAWEQELASGLRLPRLQRDGSRFSHVESLYPILPVVVEARERLEWLMRRIQEQVQAELDQPWNYRSTRWTES